MTDISWDKLQEAYRIEHEAAKRRYNVSVSQAVERYQSEWELTRYPWAGPSDWEFYRQRKAELDALCDHLDDDTPDVSSDPQLAITACRKCGRIYHGG